MIKARILTLVLHDDTEKVLHNVRYKLHSHGVYVEANGVGTNYPAHEVLTTRAA